MACSLMNVKIMRLKKMKFSIPEYLKEEEEKEVNRKFKHLMQNVKRQELREWYEDLYLYNPHEDAGDRI